MKTSLSLARKRNHRARMAHVIVASLVLALLLAGGLSPTTLAQAEGTVDVQVSTSEDDGMIKGTLFYAAENTVWIGYFDAPNSAWFRFENVLIPQGAMITSAYLTVNVYEGFGNPQIRIYGDDEENPSAPTSNDDFLNRPRTGEYAEKNGLLGDGLQNCPEMNNVVQELVDTYDYSNGDHTMQFFLDDNGTEMGGGRTNYERFWSWDRYQNPSIAATLHIEYLEPEYDDTPPIISNVQSSEITKTSAVISWTTDDHSNSTVDYGLTESLGSYAENHALTQSHSISLTGLDSGTTYYYRVSSCNFYDFCSESSIHSFTTLPQIRNTTVGNLELTATFECISVYSNFTGDEDADNQATFEYREGGGSWKQGMALTVDRRAEILSQYAMMTNPYCNQWRGSILGLSPNTEYEVRVTYTDPDGIVGTNPVVTSIRTRDDNIPLGTGNTYYVAIDGDDSNPGTEAQPFRTIQKAADTVSTGDTVLIKAGTYHETIRLTTSGTASNYITFQNYGADEVIIDVNNADTIITFGGPDWVGVSYIRIKGLHLRNFESNGILLFGESNYNVIEDNIIEDFGYDNQDVGIAITSGSAYNLIQNNSISSDRNSYSDEMHRETGISFWRGPPWPGIPGAGPGNVVRYNTIISINGGISDCIGGLENNKWSDGPFKDADIYGNTLIPGDDGVEVEGGNINVRVWENKIISPAYSGIAYAPVVIGPLYVFRNEIYDAQQVVFKVGWGLPYDGAAYIYHNTGYSNRTEHPRVFGLAPWGGPCYDNQHYRNNVIQVTRWAIDVRTEAADAAGNDFDYDNLYTGGYSQLIRWRETNYETLAAFQAASGQQLHGISADSQFVDAANANLTLQSTSPCIDRGAILLGFNDANSPWPYSGSAPDLGAYEYTSGASPGTLHHITITPGSTTLNPGQSQQFSATGYDQYDNEITGLSFTWSTDVGSIDGNGLFTAQSTPGVSGYVKASVDAIEGQATVNITGGYTPGDANGDGNVDGLDITKVERIIMGLDDPTPGADANGDDNINTLDITQIELIIMGS